MLNFPFYFAVADPAVAFRLGAHQVECTANGTGERASNASVALKTRGDFFLELQTGVNTREDLESSRLVSRMSGLLIQRSEAIVGENAFAHAMSRRLAHIGSKLTDAEVEKVFARFKEISGKKKFDYDEDLAGLVDAVFSAAIEMWSLVFWQVISGTTAQPMASVSLRRFSADSAEQAEINALGMGNGPVNALFKTVDQITRIKAGLESYSISAFMAEADAQSECIVKVRFDEAEPVTGKALSTDVLDATVKALLNALNRYLTLLDSDKKPYLSSKITTRGRRARRHSL